MKEYISMFIAAICLGTIGIFVKFIGGGVSSMTLNFYRVFFAFITLLVISPFLDKNTFKVSRNDLLMYALIGFFLAVSLSLNNVAFKLAPVQNVSLITSLFPFFVLIFAYFLLKEEITKKKIIALIIALIGLVIINPIKAEGTLGNFLSLLIAALDGLLAALMRKEDKTHSIGDVVWFFLFASIFLLPFPFIYGIGEISIFVILLGVISTGLAYLFYNYALESLEAEIGSMIILIVAPIVAIMGAFIFLGENINLRVLIGGLVLIGSGIYLEHRNRKN